MRHKLKVDALNTASGKASKGYTMFRRTSALLILSLTACTGRTMVLDEGVPAGVDGVTPSNPFQKVPEGDGGAVAVLTVDGVTPSNPFQKVPEGDGGAVVVQTEDRILDIAVDATRLYWSGRAYGPRGVVRSCLKSNCEATTIEYNTFANPDFGPFLLNGGEFFWNGGDGKLWSCTVEQCEKPRLVAPETGAFAVDQNDVYLLGAVGPQDNLRVYALPRNGEARPRRTLPAIASQTPSVGLRAQGNTVSWLSLAGALVAQPSDGSGSPRVLLNSVQDAMAGISPPVFRSSPFATDNRSVYWSVGLLAGWIARCPLDSCDGGPQIVASGQLRPRAPLATDRHLIFQRQLAGFDATLIEIVACPKDSCATQTHLGTVTAAGYPVDREPDVGLTSPMAADDSSVYVFSGEGVEDATGKLPGTIVRFPIQR